MYTIGGKWYSAMNQEYAVTLEKILKLLSGATDMKRTAWRKHVTFPIISLYGVVC